MIDKFIRLPGIDSQNEKVTVKYMAGILAAGIDFWGVDPIKKVLIRAVK